MNQHHYCYPVVSLDLHYIMDLSQLILYYIILLSKHVCWLTCWPYQAFLVLHLCLHWWLWTPGERLFLCVDKVSWIRALSLSWAVSTVSVVDFQLYHYVLGNAGCAQRMLQRMLRENAAPQIERGVGIEAWSLPWAYRITHLQGAFTHHRCYQWKHPNVAPFNRKLICSLFVCCSKSWRKSTSRSGLTYMNVISIFWRPWQAALTNQRHWKALR